MSPSAQEVVERYNLVAWNERRFDLADELLGEHIVRHGVDDVVVLTRAQARERMERLAARFQHYRFSLPVVVAGQDDEHVAIVYQAEMTGHDGTDSRLASIEVFRVVDGRIVEVWNNTHQEGSWR